MSRINNGSYYVQNNFDDYTDLVKEYINQLYSNSLELYLKLYGTNENSTGTHLIDINSIEESLSYIEDYLYYFYKFNNERFFSIFKNIIDELKSVTVFPPDKRGIYGEYNGKQKVLYINPKLTPSKKLTSSERTRLYICHELGHIQNSKWLENIIPILNDLNCSDERRQLIYDGFSLLDEATTQDRAENITYYFCQKQRPRMHPCASILFNSTPFQTNFDYYGEFQMPTIKFARTLRGIGKYEDAREIMRIFNNRSLDEQFSLDIIEEYLNDNQIDNLYHMLEKLGIIKNASYAVFGYGDRKYLSMSYLSLQEYNNLANSMCDYRDPFVPISL